MGLGDPVTEGIGAVGDLFGGLIGGLFGDDSPPTPLEQTYQDFSEPASRMLYGSKVGRRIAMGDPTVEAYYRSMLRTDPGKVNDFIDTFGADFRPQGDYSYPAVGSGAMGGNGMFPTSFGGTPSMPYGPFGSDYQDQQTARYNSYYDRSRADTSRALDQTLDRLARPTSASVRTNNGYSGFNRPAGTGNKYARLNQERKTGMFV